MLTPNFGWYVDQSASKPLLPETVPSASIKHSIRSMTCEVLVGRMLFKKSFSLNNPLRPLPSGNCWGASPSQANTTYDINTRKMYIFLIQ